MPRLGDFMTEGVVVRLAKSQGDEVGQGEVVAEIETEKLSYDLEAVAGGRFHPVVDEGATVAVDGLIAYVLDAGEAAPTPAGPASAPSSRASAARAPARRPSPARTAGDGAAVRSTPGARRTAAALNVDISQVTPTGPGGRVVEADVHAFAERRDERPALTPSTPGARRAAAELGVDISQATPTGPRGRVVESDVRAFAASRASAPPEIADAPAQSDAPDMPPGLPAPVRSEPLRGMRQGIARHMSDSLRGTAQLSYFLEVDVTEAQRLRRDASRDSDVSITLAHVLIKACAETLKRVPAMNSVLANGVIHYFDQANVGVAVALDDGLIVPVLRDAGGMSVFEIARATRGLVARARAGELSPRRSGRRDVHHQHARNGGRLHAHPELPAKRHPGRRSQRGKARRLARRSGNPRDVDPKPDRRSPGNRRRNRRRLHAPPASDGGAPGAAVWGVGEAGRSPRTPRVPNGGLGGAGFV